MALVVDATPLGENTNSYISVEDADTYVNDRVASATTVAAWAALTAGQKGLYLVSATQTLDSLVTWFGDRYSSAQNLKWPRYNVVVDGLYLDIGQTFPIPVTYATVEMALFLMAQAGEVYEENDNATYDAVAIGPLKIDFAGFNGSAKKYFPDSVAILLKDYGVIENPDLPQTGRLKVARLVRA